MKYQFPKAIQKTSVENCLPFTASEIKISKEQSFQKLNVIESQEGRSRAGGYHLSRWSDRRSSVLELGPELTRRHTNSADPLPAYICYLYG